MRLTTCFLVAVIACPLTTMSAESPNFTDDIAPLLSANVCTSCHNFATGYTQIMSATSSETQPGHPIVAPAEPDSSVLVWRLEGAIPSGPVITRMPKDSASLSAAEIALVRTWITAGAPQSVTVRVNDATPWHEIKHHFR